MNDGKTHLILEALSLAGKAVERKISDCLDAQPRIPRALRNYVEYYAEEIRASGFERGCPVGNVTMDVAANEPAIRAACNGIFNSWIALIASRMKLQGVSEEEANSLAELVISSLEGALILCKAQRSTTPLDRVAQRIETILDATLPRKRQRSKSSKRRPAALRRRSGR